MRRAIALILMLMLVLVLTTATAKAQDPPIAIRGAAVFTGRGAFIPSGVIVFARGKIVDVGADVTPPDDAEVIEAEGLFVTPGYIDAYTHIGLDFQSLWTRDALSAPSRILEISLPEDEASRWLAAGTTTVYISPGPQNLVGGLGVVMKLTGETVKEEAALSVSYGEAALSTFDAPTTRQGMVGIIRQTLVNASEDDIEGDDGRVFALTLAGSLPTRIRANTPDDILTALRLAEEFGLKLILDSAIGAHQVVARVLDANVPVVVGPSIVGLGDGGPYEGFAHTPANAAILGDRGVKIAFGTGDSGRGRAVAMEALVAKTWLNEQTTLEALTADAAEILGVDDRLGTLATGMDADIIVWEGRPVTTWAKTRWVIVDGEIVVER